MAQEPQSMTYKIGKPSRRNRGSHNKLTYSFAHNFIDEMINKTLPVIQPATSSADTSIGELTECFASMKISKPLNNYKT